jgi:hypothetical protein
MAGFFSKRFLSFFHIYFQEAFSQSDFQKGPELNNQIYKEGMHILHNYEKCQLRNYTGGGGSSSKIAKKVSLKCGNTTREFYLSGMPPPPSLPPRHCYTYTGPTSLKYFLKNSLIIHEENTKKNHKRVVSVYVIQIHVDLHKL